MVCKQAMEDEEVAQSAYDLRGITRGNRETTEQSMRHVTDQHAYEQSAGGNDEDGEEGRGGPPRVRQRLRCAVQDKACRGGRRAGKEVSG